MARFGMSPEQFLDTTPREFYLSLRDHSQIEEARLRPVLESIRMAAWKLYNTQVTKRKDLLARPEKLYRLKWDKERRPTLQTPEQMGKVFKAIARSTKGDKPRDRKRGPTGRRIRRATMEDYQKALANYGN